VTTSVLPFDQLTPERRTLAGGKGAVLAQLHRSGYPVPDGFLILPAAFAGDELTAEAWDAVRACLAHLRSRRPGMAVAVRSSALAEDSAHASFAGEFETLLEVIQHDQVREAIHRVRRSRHGARARVYSRAQGVETDHEMAVIVQETVPADLSGVLFTADPVTGSFARMSGSFVTGLGERLVSGEATGRSFTLERPHGTYAGPERLRPFARPLFRLAGRVERELGGPQDIEWAVSGDQLFLLQSRPVTTLRGYNPATGEWNATLTGDFLWSNVNLGEAMPDVMTPFTWSILQQGAIGRWIHFQGFSSIGNIGGRPYFNISVLASIFHLLGRSDRQVLEQIEGTLHLRIPPDMEIPVLPAPRLTLLAILSQMLALVWRGRRSVKRLPALLEANPAWCRGIRQRLEAAETPAQLASLWRGEIGPHSLTVWWGFLHSTNHYVEYTMRVRRQLTELVGPDDADLLISGVSSQSELLASLGPVVGASRVARGEMTREAYLAAYGHRGPHEFEFSLPRPGEDPAWVDRQLAQFGRSPVDVEALLAGRRVAFRAAWARLAERHPRRTRGFQRRIDQVGRRARLREAVRSEFGHITWIFRAWALRTGEVTGLGDDIFFLTLDEILALLSGDQGATAFIPARRETHRRYRTLPPYPAVIRGRFDPLRWAADPERRTDIYAAVAAAPAEPSRPDAVVGAAGAAGRVEGLVRRLDRPEEGDQLRPGEILVTAQANIGWTLLFPRVGAIVTDVGAPLSHAAIVARELGIPAVVGCGDATMRLRTGDRVRVDGGRGVVTLLQDR
jgi:phosphohistidine swiveling domain-containing protein